MSLTDTTGRIFENADAWWAELERRAEERHGPRSARYPRQEEPARKRAHNLPGLAAAPAKGEQTEDLSNQTQRSGELAHA